MLHLADDLSVLLSALMFSSFSRNVRIKFFFKGDFENEDFARFLSVLFFNRISFCFFS